jgi:hypothetical protein
MGLEISIITMYTIITNLRLSRLALDLLPIHVAKATPNLQQVCGNISALFLLTRHGTGEERVALRIAWF